MNFYDLRIFKGKMYVLNFLCDAKRFNQNG
jgi:hypothetical protein